ncbi:5118a848-706d-44dc-a29c-46bd06ca4716 [Sclerotinia trifoliorum]|uniref:Lysophospholipase n=1 Tax=Sclerotinia trifoliorum TaxID=28548 RepID=A0A8H2VL07_9HELO|nr:5118a848-706d-44dc-a29c-46bd06ca4716 [Sclerotinia trifoliorum]
MVLFFFFPLPALHFTPLRKHGSSYEIHAIRSNCKSHSFLFLFLMLTAKVSRRLLRLEPSHSSNPISLCRPLTSTKLINSHPTSYNIRSQTRSIFGSSKKESQSNMSSHSQYSRPLVGVTSTIMALGLFYILYQNDYLVIQPLPATRLRPKKSPTKEEEEAEARAEREAIRNAKELSVLPFQEDAAAGDGSAWGSFIGRFNNFSIMSDGKWKNISETVAGYSDFIMPEWAKLLPGYIEKLRRELNMAPGSLADEIWKEAQDPDINPEIEHSASVRVSDDICDEEKMFLQKRKHATKRALAKYLGLPEESIHPDDVPCIAMVGSGGGLRALVAGTGSMLAAGEDGLFDCVTYTAGVSGSCWLQSLFHSSLSERRLDKLVDHLKARIGVHIAYPVDALSALNSAPTNKFLLSGFVEKLKGDRNADFGLVDVYGLLLAARLLVPKGELGVDDRDLKISNQRDYIKNGENPMPIYTAVRHEIPIMEELSEEERQTGTATEATKEKAIREAWFEWFEITPYEMFCEEFGAGIPTWALGRKFEGGKDIPDEETGLRTPELRLPLLLGIFGSAFCATLSHYYREVRPLMKGLMGFGSIDDMIEGRNEDLSKVHPIDPASIPNFAYKMEGKLADTAPESIYQSTHLKLMDAGMSNNLPIYPLLRPGREVDVLIAFDASADVKTDNWLSVVDGYARQRGIKGWPIGVGWPRPSDTAAKTEEQLEEAQARTTSEAEAKLEEAQEEQITHLENMTSREQNSKSTDAEGSGDLGYCTVWVGTTEERKETDEPPLSKAVKEEWQLMEPDAGIAVVYLPFLANPKVEGVDPAISEYMSTWNFVYTPDDIDNVVKLAKANFEEGKEQVRGTIRAVYERKKRIREGREAREREERFKRKMRLGTVGKKGEGDHFYLT